MKNRKRRRLFIDRSVQGNLIRRVILYWLLCMLVVTNMAVCWLVIPKNPSSFGELTRMTYNILGPILTTSIFVVPLIIIDLIRMSNRFAGPVYRLHKEIKRLADGQEAAPIQLRKGDHWQNVAADFNRLLDRIQQEGPIEQTKVSECSLQRSEPVDAELRAIAP